MNTNQIQRFATQARNILLAGVNAKLNLLGFDADGHADAADYPKRYTDSTVFQGRVIPGTRFFEQWMELYNRIKLIGFDDVCEEAAYTWFNRLVALRILQKNGIIQPVIEYDNPAVKVPRIVNDARRGKYDFLMPSDRQQLNEVIDDDTRLFEQFQVLITAYCHNHPILKACFGGITGYTELLLPNNILVDGNFIDLLNNTDYLTDDDYRQSELIGWLYQFYISEKKDEVFASFKDGNKAEADQIPAATQIFTPNWIVKYMVQNTAGRIYLDNHPNSPLKDSWKYLVDSPAESPERATPSQPEVSTPGTAPVDSTIARKNESTAVPEPVEGSPSERGCPSGGGVFQLSSLESLTCADLSCGSGHILGEFFDLLYQIYDDELYDPRDAVEKILTHNILGIDLDTRAKQLSMFALLLKACQKDISFADAHCLPRVLDMPKPIMHRKDGVAIGDEANFSDYDGYLIASQFLDKFFSGTASEDTTKRVMQALALMGEAYNLGSIMRFDLSPEVRYSITQAVQYWNTKSELPVEVQNIMPSIQLLLALTDKYAAIAMNPPYMGGSNMNAELSKYVKDNFTDEKYDLFAVFMRVAEDHLLANAKYGMINMQSWMFLSSFEKLRTHVIDDLQIDNMLHLGPRTFDEIGGEVVQNTAFVITNAKPTISGYYFRLVDFAPSDSKKVNFLNCCRHIRVNGDISKMDINLSPYCFNNFQSNFKKIPNCPICYWIGKGIIKAFSNKKIRDYANVITGMTIGDNNKYLRLWHEVSNYKLALNHKSMNEIDIEKTKWIPYSKGGTRRQWYGNHDYVVNWSEKSNFNRAKTTLSHLYLKEALTWPFITCGNFSCRFLPQGSLWDVAGSPCFFDDKKIQLYTLGFLASKIANYILPVINPTINVQAVDINNLPLIVTNNTTNINTLVEENIEISKKDWDAHENSWDFKENELVRVFKERNTPDLKSTVYAYEREWDEKFEQLRNNEEELNRLFIEIYGLQDELSCEVPEDEVTILQQGEIGFIPAPGSENWMTRIWYDSNIIQQFISYAIGCYMGRYRLDRPGLHIAHPNPSAEELAPYELPVIARNEAIQGVAAGRGSQTEQLNNSQLFTIDEDAIIPILPIDAPFPDNAANRITNFVKLVFGSNKLTDNMNFIQDALAMSVADYMTKIFYTDHKKRYQNRPIYWLFSSKKGAFQCLVYMHRMNRFTVGRIRDNYLLPYIQHLETKLSELNVNAALLSSAERKEQKRKLAILQECREYDNILHLFADRQIDFDLDDGVLHNYSIFKDILAKLK